MWSILPLESESSFSKASGAASISALESFLSPSVSIASISLLGGGGGGGLFAFASSFFLRRSPCGGSGRSSSSLVSELLAFTKANSASVNPETIPLAEFCGELASRELEGHAVGIAVAEGISVKADRKLLARAVQNVLRNCHRHAGAGCEVRISATPDGDTVSIVVEDNGPGAPEAELARLFEPFYRPDPSRTRDTGGTGLGMAIVESSVRACGGKVSAEKSAMGGLLVRIVLPKA